MTLLIMGSKNYSSWSVRPWIFAVHANLPIDVKVVDLDAPDTAARIAEWSPSGRVPVLVLDAEPREVVWDSLAIGEHFAEAYPEAHVWPEDGRARRRARSACAEMHAGFPDLRRVLTCNHRARYRAGEWKKVAGTDSAIAAVEADLTRVQALWKDLLDASGGPFLCGGFGYVDAFFAPVVSRFATYAIESGPQVSAYRAALEATPAYQHWADEAARERWTIAKYDYATLTRA